MNSEKCQMTGMRKRKILILLISLTLVVLGCIDVTVAYLAEKTDELPNTFVPAEIVIAIDEATTENTKSDISFTNVKTEKAITGYIRATLVIYWTDTIDGNSVVVAQPRDAEVSIGSLLNNGWFQVGEIYYYENPVSPDASTTTMLDTITVTIPEGSTAQCHIDVHAEGIQALPASAVETAWSDVDVDANGKLIRH